MIFQRLLVLRLEWLQQSDSRGVSKVIGGPLLLLLIFAEDIK